MQFDQFMKRQRFIQLKHSNEKFLISSFQREFKILFSEYKLQFIQRSKYTKPLWEKLWF